jgi:hypothetical protein
VAVPDGRLVPVAAADQDSGDVELVGLVAAVVALVLFGAVIGAGIQAWLDRKLLKESRQAAKTAKEYRDSAEEWCVAARAEKLATERLAADYKLAKEAAEDANRAAGRDRGRERTASA